MKKILAIFALIMALSACDKNEEYVSKRNTGNTGVPAGTGSQSAINTGL